MKHDIAKALMPLAIEIDKLNLDLANARKHSKKNISTIKVSLARFGQRFPIVVQRQGMIVRAGNARLLAAKELGWTHIAALVVKESDIEATAFGIADNRTAELAEWDDDVLVRTLSVLLKVDSLAAVATGFSLDEIDRMIAKSGLESAEEPEVPEAPVKPISERGDVWELGDHRLLCGDCTDVTAIGALFGNVRPKMIFTDPPWNVAISKWGREQIKNDNLGSEFADFLHSWSAACLPLLDGDLYCVMGSGEWPSIDNALRDAGMHWSATIAWVKESFVVGRGKYHSRFEPIWYGWTDGGKSSFCDVRDQDNVWEFPRPKVSKEHPTMKPVALVEKAIRNSSERGDSVFDPFLGSGTTLLAAERTERVCYGVEISPAFCDVIVKRWEAMTGKKATRQSLVAT